MVKLSRSALVEKLAKKSFNECDVDGDGNIDVKELYVGILLAFDKLNKVLPVHLKPPRRSVVQNIMKKHDKDKSGHLGFEEFHDCFRSLVGINEDTNFTHTMPFQIISNVALKMAIFPLLACAIKSAMVAIAGNSTDAVPNSVVAFGLEGAYKLGKLGLQK